MFAPEWTVLVFSWHGDSIMPLTAKDYPAYIRSDQWKLKRSEALLRAGYHCCICGTWRNLHVHHNTYARLGCELMTDLAVLCETCHDVYHKHAKSKLKSKRRRRHELNRDRSLNGRMKNASVKSKTGEPPVVKSDGGLIRQFVHADFYVNPFGQKP